MPVVDGFGKGLVSRGYPVADGGVPLLQSFYFRFTSPTSASVDNHLAVVRVMPSGEKEDLTPQAFIPLDVVEDGTVELMYADKAPSSGKDEYFYKVEHANRAGVRYQLRDVGCTGTCERTLNVLDGPAGTTRRIVLVGFQLWFTGNRDHHIDEIAVFARDGKIVTKLNDKNDDDVFAYTVDFALINSTKYIVKTGTESGSARGGVQIPMPRGRKFIRGFHFDYASKDHHIREIGVLMADDHLLVLFGDKNADDLFNYSIEWMSIAPIVVKP